MRALGPRFEKRTKGASAAAVLAKELGLIPHPEGGYFLETYRAGAAPMASRGQTDGGTRNSLTSIYYLLTPESPRQWWANNMSDHVHYFHGGGDLVYRVIEKDGSLHTHTLGPACPQLVVRGGSYK
ncbi:RmlC-like cupin domain-containing protein [Pavlovales sp. CCMP2436]|nr:RmlC-like cupin domain-containing protein [Pavlovales sp. CCMP2436]